MTDTPPMVNPAAGYNDVTSLTPTDMPDAAALKKKHPPKRAFFFSLI